MTRSCVLVAWLVAASGFAVPARDATAQQHVEAGGQAVAAGLGEFDTRDVGIGARASWFPVDAIGFDAEVNWYSANLPDRAPFSGGRVEGLFGVTAGPRLGRLRPFAKLRPGFLAFQAAPQPVICVLIFPPPLSCTLAA